MVELKKIIESAAKDLMLFVPELDCSLFTYDPKMGYWEVLSEMRDADLLGTVSRDVSFNSLGPTALDETERTGIPSVMAPCDHTNEALRDCYSAAVPIRDRTGLNYGYLVAFAKSLESLTAAKILMYACMHETESAFQMEDAIRNLEMKIQFEKAIFKSFSDGILVLYPDLTISHINTSGARMINRNPEEVIGHRLTEFMLSEPKVQEVFRTGEPIIDQELFVTLPDKILHIYKTAIPVHDSLGNVIAVIDNFREIKQVRNLVNNIVGANARFSFSDIICKSEIMRQEIHAAAASAKSDLPVLIQGESGTGKELFAHAIHAESERKNGPFVIIDCASLPRDLVESELFGYTEGSFTGANRGGRPGKFELASGGTVFLDEIGEMPLEIQAKFLRVLQSYSIYRIGSTDQIPVNIRIIAATNKNLRKEVDKGNFREDLYYRLNVLSLSIAPLRDRPEDVVPLVEHMVAKYRGRLNKPTLRIAPETMDALCSYSWPGNVRELENAIARAVHRSDSEIRPEHFLFVRSERPVSWTPPLSFGSNLEALEKSKILETLKACGGNRVKAASMLGIARSTLYAKLASYGVDTVRERALVP